ncbi:MAG: class A beta-lactamase-related serine hydrolase [Candidatus Pacebacteria bacterium]|nr:class A beta-lactamase-related serine hydrolase [Candidatus Paceibacterota bacterium]
MGNVDSTSFAVYFRNLNNGPWFGINEKEKFMPASLLKVPLMIAYFKEAETDPGVLREEIVVREGNDGILSQEIKPKIILEHGKPYTVDELIERMIIYSDNKAADILFNNVSPKKLDEIYANLGIDIPIGGNINQDYMSVKSYASFFRILFNSSYLSREMSEKALSLLAKSDYKKALAAGVPSGVAIAHKFGEYKDLNRQNGYMELHDCGIIYSPDYPYLLCIMTSGRSIGENEKVITKISSIVYDEIASH